MEEHRNQLDQVDQQLLFLLSKRMEIVARLATLKQERGMPVLQEEQWKEAFARRMREAEKLKLDPRLLTAVFESIHQFSIIYQEELHHGKSHK